MGLHVSLPELNQRSAEVHNWLHRCNWHRPHGSLKANRPISRLGQSKDNLLRLHNWLVLRSFGSPETNGVEGSGEVLPDLATEA
jgi:hypothetical protein